MPQESHKKVGAIIVAGGKGRRLKSPVSKQYIEIAGKPILRHTLEKFQACRQVDEIVVVLPASDVDRLKSTIDWEWKLTKVKHVVAGGQERYHSVWAGLQKLSENVEVVLIHDGVRPFVTQRMIKESIRAARQHGAAIVGVTPKDTIKTIADETIKRTLDRDTLILVQTPQTFRREIIVSAYRQAFADNQFATDDAALVERIGVSVRIVQGEYSNIKITSLDDLIFASALMERGEAP